MGADLLSFERALDAWEQSELPALWIAFAKKVALDLHGRVVRKTPRDTGRAQNAWVVSAVTPSPWEPPEGADSYSAASQAGALAALAALRAGDDIYISNNLVYIVPLNDGHSKQAPAQFVELSIAETQALMARL